MRRLGPIVLAACLATGCAGFRLHADGALEAWAFAGGGVERCIPQGEAGIVRGAPEECIKVHAESIPSAVLGIIGQGLAALVSWVIP